MISHRTSSPEPIYIAIVRFVSIVVSFGFVIVALFLTVRETMPRWHGWLWAAAAFILGTTTIYANLSDRYEEAILRWARRVAITMNALLAACVAFEWMRHLLYDWPYDRKWPAIMLLAVAGTNLAALSLKFVTERIDRKWCPKCGYDLRGSDSPRCPECGAERGDASSAKS